MSQGPDSITVHVIGDSGHFSSGGKGSAFVASAGDSRGFLIDCGASPFAALGSEALGELQGLIATHSHEDHKRWLSEIALFFRYDVRPSRRLRLYSTETIHQEIRLTSQAALERTLSDDLLRVIDVPYEEFVEQILIGPRALYRIEHVPAGGPEGEVLRVVDGDGNVVPPGRAKVVVSPVGARERMLFFDEDYSEWVEPEEFYPFSAGAFYEPEGNPAVDPGSGMTIRPVKAAAWHGPPTFSVVLETPGGTRVALSSDIRFDPELWRRLADEAHEPSFGMSAKEFDSAHIVVGDINDYVQRTWSRGRYEAAVSAFDDCVVFHDSDATQTVVHTPYDNLEAYSAGPGGRWRSLILAYTPDYFVGRWPLTARGRTFRITGADVHEALPSGKLAAFAADIYAKSGDRFYAGRLDEGGAHRLVRTQRGFDVIPRLPTPRGMGSPPELDESACEEAGRVRLYRDLGGRYVPASTAEGEHYRVRDDGRIELLTEEPGGSTGRIVEDERPSMEK